jgi:hypothetical protein
MRKQLASIMPIHASRTGRLARTKWSMANIAMVMSSGWKALILVQDYFQDWAWRPVSC